MYQLYLNFLKSCIKLYLNFLKSYIELSLEILGILSLQVWICCFAINGSLVTEVNQMRAVIPILKDSCEKMILIALNL